MSDDFSPFAESIYRQKYAQPGETWPDTATRVVEAVMGAGDLRRRVSDQVRAELIALIVKRRFMPGGRYLYAAGRPFHQVQNCLLLRAEDSREGWAELMHKATMALMTGAGIGIDYSAVRPQGAVISRTGGFATGPLALMQMVNEAGRHIMQGGARRSAIWGGLNWRHADALAMVAIKDWSPAVRQLKAQDFNASAVLDGTNISIILDRAFFEAYAAGDSQARAVYWATIRSMLATAEPGFSVDYADSEESLRNACCEITSADDSDVCNLGSLNLAKFDSLADFRRSIELATMFLLAGTVYSDLPYPKVGVVRQRNRRLGLGLMGIHEWLLNRGLPYGAHPDLGVWLAAYRDVSTATATAQADDWGLSRPVKTRAIAPTGTLSIVAECTSGIEPLYCVAYKRRYKGPDGLSNQFQYVVDPAASRLIARGVSPAAIEDAYTLSTDVERRVAFQAWVQQYVDHGISSTINLPAWGSEYNRPETVEAFGDMLLKYLPQLRGVTCYPDGARGGQPLTPVSYETATAHVGEVFVEQADLCELTGKGEGCGS